MPKGIYNRNRKRKRQDDKDQENLIESVKGVGKNAKLKPHEKCEAHEKSEEPTIEEKMKLLEKKLKEVDKPSGTRDSPIVFLPSKVEIIVDNIDATTDRPESPDAFLTCFEKMPEETKVDLATMVFNTVGFGQPYVFPTTPLEKWIVELNIPTFRRPLDIVPMASIIVFPRDGNDGDERDGTDHRDGVLVFIVAFCRETRQCLLTNEQGHFFKIDGNELFHSKYIVVDTFPRDVSEHGTQGNDSSLFPYQLPVQSLDNCLQAPDRSGTVSPWDSVFTIE